MDDEKILQIAAMMIIIMMIQFTDFERSLHKVLKSVHEFKIQNCFQFHISIPTPRVQDSVRSFVAICYM